MLFSGFASFSPNQDPSLQYSQFSPKSLIDTGITNTVPQSPSNSNNTVAKPKKFFKSRNSVPDANAIVAALSDSQIGSGVIGSPPSYYSSPGAVHQLHQQAYQQHTVAFPEKTKRKKSVTKSGETPRKAKAEKPPKPEKPPKVEKPPKPEKPPKVEKPAKPAKAEKLPKATKKKAKAPEKSLEPPKPTRVLSRTRKVVNYSEDQSRSPPRNAQTNHSKSEPIQEPVTNDSVLSSMPATEIANNNLNTLTEQNLPQSSQSYNDEQYAAAGDSPSKSAVPGPPPIVLRISKVSI